MPQPWGDDKPRWGIPYAHIPIRQIVIHSTLIAVITFFTLILRFDLGVLTSAAIALINGVLCAFPSALYSIRRRK